MSADVSNASEACKTISSEADNIRAAGEAGGRLLGFLNPKNWGSDNEVKQQVKNIFGIDMSTETVTNIRNTCGNIFAGSQENILDFTECEYCKNHECVIKNFTQSNKINTEQLCGANAFIDVLKNNTTDIKSLAAIKAIQDSKGLASGNKLNYDLCNYVRVDLSSSDYLDALAQCNNSVSMAQANTLKSCGGLEDTIQKNEFNNYQKCIATSTLNSEGIKKFDLTSDTGSENNQQSVGFDPMDFLNTLSETYSYAISGSLLSLALSCCCILILVAIFAFS